MTSWRFHSWLKQGRVAVGGGLMAIALTACSTPPRAHIPVTSAPPETTAPVTTLPPASQNPPSPTASSTASSTTAPSTAPTPTTESTGSPEASEQAAVQVVRSYYSAIAQQDYQQAYSAWGHNGSDSQQSFEQFKQGFAHTASTRVDVGEPSNPNGAAGSTYIEIPVTVTATTTNGTKQKFQGNYVLKRVNDVPGSTAAQRQWHLYSANLMPAS